MIDHSHIKLLVVEDEVTMARAMLDRFRAEGFKVALAKNGQEGLKYVEKEYYDIVLLDLAMPKVSGMEMMEKMRQMEFGKHAPIIIYTNLVPSDEILQGVSRDKPTYYLSKTEHSLDYVIEMIDRIISERAGNQDLQSI